LSQSIEELSLFNFNSLIYIVGRIGARPKTGGVSYHPQTLTNLILMCMNAWCSRRTRRTNEGRQKCRRKKSEM